MLPQPWLPDCPAPRQQSSLTVPLGPLGPLGPRSARPARPAFAGRGLRESEGCGMSRVAANE